MLYCLFIFIFYIWIPVFSCLLLFIFCLFEHSSGTGVYRSSFIFSFFCRVAFFLLHTFLTAYTPSSSPSSSASYYTFCNVVLSIFLWKTFDTLTLYEIHTISLWLVFLCLMVSTYL
ncbi:hypothetical protein BDD12DRAFT_819152 [Trichophaea hybrida]|nr:hypothetical protein BDD12DRAFT_819152 [Trichophaea hybrida]